MTRLLFLSFFRLFFSSVFSPLGQRDSLTNQPRPALTRLDGLRFLGVCLVFARKPAGNAGDVGLRGKRRLPVSSLS